MLTPLSRRLPTVSRVRYIGASRLLTTIGIRKEDPGRVWERRTPLTPTAVEALINDGKGEVAVEVEECGRRCFPNADYRQAGAAIVPSLSPKVDLVLGIKEPPVPEVQKLVGKQPGKKRSWMVFSHTHKGQAYNTALLSALMDNENSQTLVDYELLTAPSENGNLKRVAAFGWYAGTVGAGEALSLTGLALLRRGEYSPLLHLARPYTFGSISAFEDALKATNKELSKGHQDPSVTVIGLTGSGNVSTGAAKMLDQLHVQWVEVDELQNLKPIKGVYACKIPPKAYLQRKDGGVYDRKDYYEHPEAYKSVFADKVAPYLTTLINGAGWQPGFPRLMSNEDASRMVKAAAGRQRMVAVQDITCDLKGPIEFVDRPTTIDAPFFEGPGGMLVSSIDILPTELPSDASAYFSSRILPYVEQMIPENRKDAAHQETISRATIVRDGKLTDTHQWLEKNVSALRTSDLSSSSSTVARQRVDRRKEKKRVLLLGSGLVAGPAVEVFAARPDVQLAIGSNNLREAEGLVKGRGNVEAFALDVGDSSAVQEAVARSDVVVSLLPAPMHTGVAKHCISTGKHLVTASYILAEMKALHKEAANREVLLLGECGLDPGIDSMAAMRIMERVKREGKRVTSFISWCGGLPEPAASNAPLGYKFSWSPKAVLTAAQNEAKFIQDSKERTIPGSRLLAEHFPKVDLWKGLALEGLANRDSMPYAEKYGLGPASDLKNLFRGTLRYQGFSTALEAFRKAGFLSSEKLGGVPKSWDEFFSHLKSSSGADRDVETLLGQLRARVSTLSPPSSDTPVDLFASFLSQTLAYGPGEQDAVYLHHEFLLAPPSGTQAGEKVTASLYYTGTEEASAMSTTVGKTLAFAALRVLDGEVSARGVQGPYEREVWEGVLDRLGDVGVKVIEEWQKIA